MGDGIMKLKFVMPVILSLMLVNTTSAADVEGGVNVEPVIEETIFNALSHTEITHDLENWEVTMTLNDAAYNNNTTFALITQICNNEGVCLPPEEATLSTVDNRTFTSAVTTIVDHTYVNWRVKATYNSDNDSTEMFPSSGFYKTWSDCWLEDGEWGGDGCPESAILVDGDSDGLPALGIMATFTAIALAAVSRNE
ncbi:MAG: hypothetical protein HOE76_07240 [Euryarchaeota archaeon]|jgi:hypothetical protein|nr:hypothetical protein [Euryarchaeota archaeon]